DRPTNTVKPTISGLPAAVGQTITAITGTWTGNPFPTLTVQWQRCDSKGAGCTDIAGAISFFYVVADADAGSTLRVAVTGTNTIGVSTVFSAITNVIPATPPSNVSSPFISGSTTVGQVLSTSVGTWTGTPPITYTFRWQRCDTSGTCTDIPGATGTSYTLVQADVGDTIIVYVTATNALGSATEASDHTA